MGNVLVLMWEYQRVVQLALLLVERTVVMKVGKTVMILVACSVAAKAEHLGKKMVIGKADLKESSRVEWKD